MSKSFIVALLLSFVAPAFAGPHLDAANQCLADSTTGKDRKVFARWLFIAMAAHPEIRDTSAVTKETSDASSRDTGRLVTRLLTENCANEMKALVRNEGQQALPQTFQILGQLAMQELMANKEVTTSISGFQQYVDTKRITEVLEAK